MDSVCLSVITPTFPLKTVLNHFRCFTDPHNHTYSESSWHEVSTDAPVMTMTKTHTKTKTKTKWLKDPTCAIFLKMIWLKDVKYDDDGWHKLSTDAPVMTMTNNENEEKQCITCGASLSVYHLWWCITDSSYIIIFDILESYHFQKYGTCWVF